VRFCALVSGDGYTAEDLAPPQGLWIDAALNPTADTLWISNYRDTVTRIDLR
jgi:hypothetical protein